MDMLGTLSGINVNRINFGEKISMSMNLQIDRVGRILPDFKAHLSDRTRRIAETLYGL